MFSSNLPNSSNQSSSPRGVEICVEALTEWKIQEIGYDGIEKYIRPLTFKEVVAKNAENINWKEIIGKESSLDVRQSVNDNNEKDEMEIEEDNLNKEAVLKVEPAAGPWMNVAKDIHMTLQELNVLLDTLHLLKSQYIAPISIIPDVLLPEDPKLSERIIASKCFQFYMHKKALLEGQRIISDAKDKRDHWSCMDGTKSFFFSELRKIRENWRVRKVNDSVFGDLSYRTYGQKFHPSEIFDIIRRVVKEPSLPGVNNTSKSVSNKNIDLIEVQVPRNFMRRTALCVYVQKDTKENCSDLFKSPRPSFREDPEKIIHWEKALKWAQETLICRDIYARLLRDCVNSKRIYMPGQNCLVIALFDDIIIKIEQKFYPFEEGEINEDGDLYLNKLLREIFIADQCKRPFRNQQFISLPQTTLPENLDLRGPQALSTDEINSRKVKSTSLLNRLIEISSHYVLVRKVITCLKKHVIKFSDPQIQFKFVRSTSVFSIISVVLINRCFEIIGKHSLHVRIFADKIIVVTKEAQQIHCRRDMKLFRDALWLITSNFLLNSVAMMSKTYAWQILHANNNAFNSDGNPAPSFYSCNQKASKLLFIQFPADGSPILIYLKLKNDSNEPIQAGGPNSFVKLNYEQLPGTSFMRKIDFIFSAFRN